MGSPTITSELFEGEHLDTRENWSELPCPDCGRVPIAILFAYSDNDDLILDVTKLGYCRVKKNMIYVHEDPTDRIEITHQNKTCPECGYRPRKDETLESENVGVHADQHKIRCPECGELSWGQGWYDG